MTVGIIFHGIGTPKRPLEQDEAPYWISEDQFRHVLDMIVALPDPNQIRISFDDSNVSDLEIGLPELSARGLVADFFVLTGRIGQAGSLDAPDIQTLQQQGMTIGTHGVDHLNWANLPADKLHHELTASRATLEEICGQAVTTAGIPFGAYNAAVLKALRQVGYTCAYSSDCGKMDPNAFLRPRASVQGKMTNADFRALIAGHLSVKRKLRRFIGMTRKRLT
ncbi:polysaccharide deacetylase family protein [Aliiroseovarius sp. Z3]|uniref:polysaccharide deacetylase family protein n=1 Tax=Aliiroseovarius sp. Z3 TaxID=2811402 RepID=UPI0023B23C45|nr:polysaccharide deacetylase family protein [Aliiroseovarius sp. Z3]MDE9451594.1 polysaccharide deacetylase family protein [Aliiroseovarius sp. Z3]